MSGRGVLRIIEGGLLGFWCPGCNSMHSVNSGWTFDGNYDRPTFSPSVLVRWTRMTEKGRADWSAWIDAGAPRPAPAGFDHVNIVCHSFVEAGSIRFLNDCTHALAGQTVALEPY